MARDLNIKGTAGIIDTDRYVYRKERDMTKTQVNWNEVTNDLTDTINKIRDDRESRKAEIEKKTRIWQALCGRMNIKRCVPQAKRRYSSASSSV